MREAIGYVMIALPFVGLGALIWSQAGFLATVGLFATVAAVVGVIVGGCYLAFGS